MSHPYFILTLLIAFIGSLAIGNKIPAFPVQTNLLTHARKKIQLAIFQSTSTQQLISQMACAGGPKTVTEHCEGSRFVFRVEGLRFQKEKDKKIRIGLRTNLGNFLAKETVTHSELLSGKTLKVAFPQKQQNLGKGMAIDAVGGLQLRWASGEKRFHVPHIWGNIRLEATVMGMPVSEADRAEAKNLISESTLFPGV